MKIFNLGIQRHLFHNVVRDNAPLNTEVTLILRIWIYISILKIYDINNKMCPKVSSLSSFCFQQYFLKILLPHSPPTHASCTWNCHAKSGLNINVHIVFKTLKFTVIYSISDTTTYLQHNRSFYLLIIMEMKTIKI